MSAVHEESRSNEAVDAALAVRTLALAQITAALAREIAATFSKYLHVHQAEVKLLIVLVEYAIAATTVFPDLPPEHREAGSEAAADLTAVLGRLIALSR